MKYCVICTAALSRPKVDGSHLCGDCVNSLTNSSITGKIKNHDVATAVRNMVTAALQEARAAADGVDTADEMVAELHLRSKGL